MYTLTVKNLSLFIAGIALLLALILRLFFIGSFRSEKLYFRDVQRNITQSLDQLSRESQEIQRSLSQLDSVTLADFTADYRHPFYIFRQQELQYWSDYRFVPSYEQVSGNAAYQFKEFDHGSYVIHRDTINGYEIFHLLLIRNETTIDNQYMSSGYNPRLFPQPETIEVRTVSAIDAATTIIHYRDHTLFALLTEAPPTGYREHSTAKSFQALVTTLIAASILLLLYNVYRRVQRQFRRQQIDAALLVVILSLLLLRAIMIYFNYPYSILPIELFDGKQFAASSVNPSLGDLLLNSIAVLIVAAYLFIYYRDSRLYRRLLQTTPIVKMIISVVGLLLSFMALFWHYDIIRSIYYNSQWTLDVTESLSFTNLRNISLLIFIINSISYFLGVHIIFRTCISLSQHSYLPMRVSFVIALGIGLLLSALGQTPTFAMVILGAAYFIVLYLFNLPRFLTRISYITFLYVFAGAFVSAAACAIAAYDMYQIETLDNKQKFANQLLVDNDILGEYLLQEAGEKIKNDPLIKNRLFSPLGSKNIIRQKIKRIYLGNYFDRYEIKVHLFNSKGQTLDERPTYTYDEWKEDVSSLRFATEYPNIFFINQNKSLLDAESGQRYYLLLDIENFGNTIGSIIVELVLRRFTPNQVYPELLVDRSSVQDYLNTDFRYAIITPVSQPDESPSNQISFTSGNVQLFDYFINYDFQAITGETSLDRGDYNYLMLKGQDDEYIVIASPVYSFINIISNFSFLFLLLVFAILLLLGLYSSYFVFSRGNLNFSTKIQLYLNAAFFMPLLALSITTISIISSSYNQEVDQLYLERTDQISRNLVAPFEDFSSNNLSPDELSETVNQIASVTETDLNVFDTSGKLVVASQPLIYENGLLSRYINTQALVSIREEGETKLVLEESVGDLSYKSSYVGLRSFQTGQLLGIISIPFFESRSQLESRIIQVLTNVMNIFTFVFIAFLIISYLASVLLTYPLKYITQKIRRTSLSDYNEPLSWDSNDEIGLMVGEYNRMLVNLEASKAALARNEKESAWREMAKQVAHEIKNPLTPMKLSLQLLKRRLAGEFKHGMDSEEVQKMDKPLDTLLHQIDTLSDIASSFSNFAQMPLPKSEPYELTAVVRRTVSLYAEENIAIDLDIQGDEFVVLGDKQLMGRILSNLIINAKQSIPKEREPNLQVSLQKFSTDRVILKVSDNGTGIAKEIQNKVFLPNFSTKYAGSGIGLAIAKRGIEHVGGRITFDTKEGVGTTFLIELPLVTKQQSVVEL
ncbi:sensor histidine kinase [Tunicatimonas pelagia]|uniref:sensor histidine kinase n=1 Tax=Tunicatimonas pelagia TaxID=931531 RepID=UPI00266701C3|nr:ATP-binding protein [Tunicatimonas pelagia]WKN42855.1 ATP-binding protein [Tunicatimonas pelagia]